jgi:hypothetical protein
MKHHFMAVALAACFATPSSIANTAAPDCNCKEVSEPKVVKKVRPRRVRAIAPAPAPKPLVPLPNVSPVATASVQLANGNDHCVGAAPGASLGSGQVWMDRNCVLMRKSAMLTSLGKPEAALALLCRDVEMRHALESSGTPCPGPSARP